MKKRIFSFIPVGLHKKNVLDFPPEERVFITGRVDLSYRAGGLFSPEYTVNVIIDSFQFIHIL